MVGPVRHIDGVEGAREGRRRSGIVIVIIRAHVFFRYLR